MNVTRVIQKPGTHGQMGEATRRETARTGPGAGVGTNATKTVNFVSCERIKGNVNCEGDECEEGRKERDQGCDSGKM